MPGSSQIGAGYFEDANGTILVSGAGSKITAGQMEIGWIYGSGWLTVENGAEVEGISCHIGELGGQGVATFQTENSPSRESEFASSEIDRDSDGFQKPPAKKCRLAR